VKSHLALPALSLLLTAVALQAGMAREVGSAGAVNPAARGTPPSRPTRVLELGARVIHKERIQTTGSGSVQLIFIDKTTLSVGPNSDIIIDEFIYDPSRGSGQMAVSMAKGVLRFVGGNISHAGGATVKTPVATIGIRGGVATIKHNPCTAASAASAAASTGFECGTRAINHFGVMSLATGVDTEIIRRPGFAVSVVPGGAISPPVRVSQAEIEATNRQLSSKGGQSGGARSRPTEETAARAGVGAQNAGVTPSIMALQSQNTAGAATAMQPGAVQQAISSLQQQAGANATQAAIEHVVDRPATQPPPPPPSEPPPPEPPPSRPLPTGIKVFALATSPDPALNSPIPYVAGTVVASGAVQIPLFRRGFQAVEAAPLARYSRRTHLAQTGPKEETS
jgi:FecR protein